MKKRIVCLIAALLMMLTAVTAMADGFMPTRKYNDVTYEGRSSNSLTTMLLIGYDHQDDGLLDTKEPANFISGGQSDFLLLLVFDHDAKQIRQLQINRDTMTAVRYYSREGKYYGTRNLQICLSHAYGNTQEQNNRNTIWAVENLLGIDGTADGAQIDAYISMDISGISALNDLLGGVAVPINDDFSYFDETMVKGTTMTLKGKQAEYYTRGRHHVADHTNVSRMSRQRIYMEAAAKQLRNQIADDPNFARELLQGMGLMFDTTRSLDAAFGFTTTDSFGTPITDTPTHYLMTNQSLDTLVALMLRVMDYEILATEELPGKVGLAESGFIECIVEKNVGLEWALEALYRTVK